MKTNSITPATISFQRRLKPHEKIENRVLIQEGKKSIGLDNMMLVTHSMSLPSTKTDDTGIGVLSKNHGTLSYIDLAYDNGFDGILLEPGGTIKAPYYSPYEASLMSKKVVADLKALTTPKWGEILPRAEFDAIVKNKQYDGEQKNRTIYDYAIPAHKGALELAYSNFVKKLEANNPVVAQLNEKFKNYKAQNALYLEKDAVYSILSDIHENDYYPAWKNELHKNLFDSECEEFSAEQRAAEYEKIKSENKDRAELYMFSQFVVDTQQRELADYASNISKIKLKDDVKTLEAALKQGSITQERFDFLVQKLSQNAANSHGINLIGDKPVGFSNMDIWANKDLFTTDEFLGAAPNLMKKRAGQDWNFPFISHEKLFDNTGTGVKLARGGEYMKQVFKKMLSDNPGGLRIDHILGLIDPWTYQIDETADPNDETVRHSNNGSRYIFKNLLQTDLKELVVLGFNTETIKGIIDPLGAIYGAAKPENERTDTEKQDIENLKNRGITDFEGAKKIVELKQDAVLNAYSKIIDKILLAACKEIATEQAQRRGEVLSEVQIAQKALDLVICEDLGTYTKPLKMIMDASHLKGMRHAGYSDPINPEHKYREGNKNEQGHYWLMGSHDDPPYINQVKKPDFNRAAAVDYIGTELGLDKSTLTDEYAISRAKVARMMSADKNPETPNNLILNWLDLFGKTQQYNTPGLSDKKANWTLRTASSDENLEKTQYSKVLPKKQGINIDESLAVSMRACGVDEENSQIYAGLKKYAEIVEEVE